MPLIIPTNSISDLGFSVANSCRFDDGSSDSLTRTPASDGDRQKWTTSQWVKRSTLGVIQLVFSCGVYSESFSFRDDDTIYVQVSSNNTTAHAIQTNRVFRDTSAWYHIVVAVDTTQATASNRLKLYVNGVEETSLAIDQRSAITQNMSTAICGQFEHRFGIDEGSTNYYGGYIAEAVLVDGQQLDPTSFGEFDADTGIWKPIDVSGLTFGTNGFYLDFENSGSLGADVSGNGNNFTVNNLTSIDQTNDTPTNNYPTINILQNYNSQLISEGNTKFITTSNTAGHKQIGTTFGVDTGKWYWEVKGAVAGNDAGVGISSESVLNNPANLTGSDGHIGDDPESWGYFSTTGNIVNNNSGSAYGASWNTEIIGVALDLDNAKLYFSKSGTWQNSGDPESGATGTGAVSITSGLLYFPATSGYDNGHGVLFNFGNPAFTISSGNSDGRGYGNFEYAVPSGYYALNTKNLSEFG